MTSMIKFTSTFNNHNRSTMSAYKRVKLETEAQEPSYDNRPFFPGMPNTEILALLKDRLPRVNAKLRISDYEIDEDESDDDTTLLSRQFVYSCPDGSHRYVEDVSDTESDLGSDDSDETGSDLESTEGGERYGERDEDGDIGTAEGDSDDSDDFDEDDASSTHFGDEQNVGDSDSESESDSSFESTATEGWNTECEQDGESEGVCAADEESEAQSLKKRKSEELLDIEIISSPIIPGPPRKIPLRAYHGPSYGRIRCAPKWVPPQPHKY